MNIEGAIFDLDGTLMDSMFIWDTIGEDYLRSRGVTPRENLRETFKSMSLLQAARYYRREYGLEESEIEIMAGVNAQIAHYYEGVVRAKPGAAELLRALSRRGARLCVATATDRPLVEAALARNGLSGYFERVFTCTEVGAGKDRPDIYHLARECLGTKPEATYVFEDALYALRTAKAAGYPVVGVYDASEAAHQAEIQALSDVYVRSLAEMEAWL